MSNKNDGENRAVDYLIENGYKILFRNWRLSGGEIDIIALKDDVLVFVEVKTLPNSTVDMLEKVLNKEKQPEIKPVPKVEKIELIEEKTIDKQEEQIKQVEEHIEKEETIEEQPTQPITKVNEEPREEVEVGRFCPTCGHENKNKGRFCSICGRSLIIKK